MELLVVVTIILILLAVAIPAAKSARFNATETVVIREMQTIFQAQMQYRSQYGRCAAYLTQLGPPASGEAGPDAAGLIPRSLASGEKDGYLFRVSLRGAAFEAWARPKELNVTGRRAFCIDDNGVVHQNWGREDATAESPEIQ